MSAGFFIFVNFGLYLVWMLLFAAFVAALFGIAREDVEEREHPHIFDVLDAAHESGELTDEEYRRNKALIEQEIEGQKRVA